MLYYFQVYSKMIQLCMYIHLFFFKFFSQSGCYITVSRVPCSLFVIHFKYRLEVLIFFCHRLPQAVSSVQLLSHVRFFATPMDCSTPGFPVHHQLPEFVQTHVHQVSDSIQPSHLLSSPSPAFKLSQHQSLFQWGSFSHQVAKVLECQLQHQSLR